MTNDYMYMNLLDFKHFFILKIMKLKQIRHLYGKN